jgi:hypothetical protein
MTDTSIQRIRELKTEAKNRRDRGLRRYPRAVELLHDAIQLGKADLDAIEPGKADPAGSSATEVQAQLAVELADCHGLLGGVERRWALEGPAEDRAAHLLASISAYDDGCKLEADERHGIVNSYNRVNRLLVRLLLQPELLGSRGTVDLGGGTDPLDVREELAATATAIADQLAGPRRGDHWAMADLALIQVLLDQADAVTAYARFNAASPPDYVYTSVLAGLRPLADLPLSSAPTLRNAVRSLETKLQSLRS